MANPDREFVQQSAHVPSGPRTEPIQIPKAMVSKLKIANAAGRESVRQSPARSLNGT
jgi:hypothetical protein